MIDGALSAGVGVAFGLSIFLRGTPLAVVLPVMDSIIVLVLCALIIKQPVSMFLTALAEIAGVGAKPSVVNKVRAILMALPDSQDYQVIDLAVTKLGRFHLAMIYLNPLHPVDADWSDQLTRTLKEACTEQLGLIEIAIVLTETPQLNNF